METPTPPVSPEAVSAGHEPETFALRGYLIFLIVFVLLAVVFQFVLWFVMDVTSYTPEWRQAPTVAPQMLTQPQGPAPPNLQPSPMDERTPAQDMQRLRFENSEMLNHYTWGDYSHGVVRVPIDQAIDDVARRGLPTTMNAEESP